MFVRAMLPFVVVLCVAADDPKKDAKKALDELQGDWTMVSLEIKGKKAESPDFKLTIKGNDWAVTTGTGTAGSKITIKLDPTKSPMQLDMTTKVGEKEQVSLGIYKLEGDTLTLCRVNSGGERPKEFKTSEDAGILVVWKRVKK